MNTPSQQNLLYPVSNLVVMFNFMVIVDRDRDREPEGTNMQLTLTGATYGHLQRSPATLTSNAH